ncbi:hypothetical protein RN22_09300 [Grimontia sp. AD028]|uniref:hypothetical protein n=1 Tax=Grimontia sp. AD028 TaxID=1581149 RepID=UPI00061AE25B|nr:hypothetical protein [Grimontia sp. AD028]KKD60773.1 hypothetical protein RN22_09300 [Grimontia sp. AD028]
MYTDDGQDIIHTASFDEWGFCSACGMDEATCECPGPADVFMNNSHVASLDTFGAENVDD